MQYVYCCCEGGIAKVVKTRCKEKQDVSPSSCPPSRQCSCTPCTTSACTHYPVLVLSYATAICVAETQKLNCVDKAHKHWLLWGSKNFRLIIDSHSSTNPENMAKICPVDVEIIDVTETEANIFLWFLFHFGYLYFPMYIVCLVYCFLVFVLPLCKANKLHHNPAFGWCFVEG